MPTDNFIDLAKSILKVCRKVKGQDTSKEKMWLLLPQDIKIYYKVTEL